MANKEGVVNLSEGNSKMGRVLHVNLPPVKTCSPDLPCHHPGQCYSLKAWRSRPTVRKSWMHNWKLYDQYPARYFDSIREQIRTTGVFRWHSSGDIPDSEYLIDMYKIAHQFPSIKFMAFTKRYDLLTHVMNLHRKFWRPPNMTMVVSGWPGLAMPHQLRKRFPVAWVKEAVIPDPRIPKDAIKCSGQCDQCLKCWHLKKGDSVYFNKH